jgi:hypothetical protein
MPLFFWLDLDRKREFISKETIIPLYPKGNGLEGPAFLQYQSQSIIYQPCQLAFWKKRSIFSSYATRPAGQLLPEKALVRT